MNPRLRLINLFGVVALTVLCVFQWQRDRRLHLELRRVEKTKLAQDEKISEQEKLLQGMTHDLEHFKGQFSTAHSNLLTTEESLQSLKREMGRIAEERDQLKVTLTNWMNAVSNRDTRLTEANDQIRALAEKGNEAVRKLNELATNYNVLVERWNQAQEAKTSQQTSVQAAQ